MHKIALYLKGDAHGLRYSSSVSAWPMKMTVQYCHKNLALQPGSRQTIYACASLLHLALKIKCLHVLQNTQESLTHSNGSRHAE